MPPRNPFNDGCCQSLKQRLLNGFVAYGSLLMTDSHVVAELLALSGYDFLIIDHEHSSTSLQSSQRLLQSIQSSNAVTLPNFKTEPVIRLPSANDPVYMKKVLDSLTLPGGVLVPMVEDVETAKLVVESTRYPLQRQSSLIDGGGIRGCAAPFVRGSSYGYKNTDDYLKQCEDDLLVLVQVETAKGVEAISDIASIPGIDGVFLGPFDLSTSIGKMGAFDDAEVQTLISDAERAVVDGNNNCILAGFRPPNRRIEEMVDDAGYRFLCGSVDVGLLKESSRNDLLQARSAMRKKDNNSK